MEKLFIKSIYKRKLFQGRNTVNIEKQEEEMTNQSPHLEKATANIFEE